ncbi:MAG: hypothetical protein SFY32_13015 [Bacteroidota bacterium]|nr:hypothetical protein [Bacteroidota bacterium]
MAIQKGIIKIEGTVGGMTFYKTQDGHLVKEKSSISADKIANDPAFARTRENGAEFGEAAAAGKLIRDTFRNMMASASDNRVTSRLVSVLTTIKNFDTTSERGERKVSNGLAVQNGQNALKDFDFNLQAKLGSILFKPLILLPGGNIQISGLVPIQDVNAPAGATHASVTAAIAHIDFTTGGKEISISSPVNFPLNSTSLNVNLVTPPLTFNTGPEFRLFKIEFFQEVNGFQYSLKNGSFNALSIVNVQ